MDAKRTSGLTFEAETNDASWPEAPDQPGRLLAKSLPTSFGQAPNLLALRLILQGTSFWRA